MSQNSNKKDINEQQFQYFYFKDTQGRMQRIRKLKYEPRPGYIRVKFLEKIYIKWIRCSYDSKLTWLPWIAGLSMAACIYHAAMVWSQNDLNRQIKARLPFDYKYEQVQEVNRLLKQHNKTKKPQEKRKQSLL